MNQFQASRSTIITPAFLLGLMLMGSFSLSAQVRPPGRIGTLRVGASQAQLPDIEVQTMAAGWEDEVFHIEVWLQNRGNAKSESANVNAPFKVWLRIWKPTDAKSAEGPTSGKNSFLWGGVVTVNELIRPDQSKKVRFTISTVPPGDWQTTAWGRTPESLKDPLHWRAMVIVDSAGVIKESNETNNTHTY